jgi:hypothetical protein
VPGNDPALSLQAMPGYDRRPGRCIQGVVVFERSLIKRLRRSNPDLRVIWLPWLPLHPLSWATIVPQKILRPGRKPLDAAPVFAQQSFDTSQARRLSALVMSMDEQLTAPLGGGEGAVR